ncbi:MAG: hypothetical protein RR869_06640 [Lachnospiraceae bacterium]
MKKLTKEQTQRTLELLFLNDEEYYERFLSKMSREEFKSFLKECPEFLEDHPEFLEEKE